MKLQVNFILTDDLVDIIESLEFKSDLIDEEDEQIKDFVLLICFILLFTFILLSAYFRSIFIGFNAIAIIILSLGTQ